MSQFNQSYSSSRPATSPEELLLSTRALHGPRTEGRRQGPLVGAIVQSTTFHQAKLGAHVGPTYSRVANPTVDDVEEVLGALEGALPAVSFGTGLGAETALFLAVLRAGDHAVVGQAIYGGTTRLFRQVLSELGVSSTFVDSSDTAAIAAAIQQNTRVVFIETPANPTLKLTDIEAVAAITHGAGDGKILLVVDNTFLTPVLQRPLDLGADVSVYSTTKLIEGHSSACGGAVVSRDRALLDRVRWMRKCTGGIQAPFNAWLTARGIKTLPLRVREQSRHAQVIAEWLAKHPHVAQVYYPGLPDFPEAALAAKQHREGLHGNVVSFDVKGGAEAGRAVLEGAEVCSLVEHVGGVETLLTHPVSMTHADVPEEQRRAAGITNGLIRLSVGLEEPEEIIRDLDQALRAAHAPARAEASLASAAESSPAAPKLDAPLVVLKLGGSILRTEGDLRTAVHEVYGWLRRGWKAVVVVSALEGVTDSLVQQASAYGTDADRGARALLTGTGELTSASLLGLALDRAGVRATVATPSQIELRAAGDPLDATPSSVDRAAVLRLFRDHDAIVVPGFVAEDSDGRLVLLGRGGSDLSALFLAHALEANICRLVKDVSGLYEYDPGAVKHGRPAPRRYATLPWTETLKLDGGIVQHKAIRAAAGWKLPFEVGAPLASDATRVGSLPVVFEPAKGTAGGRPKRVVLLGCGSVGFGVHELLQLEAGRFEIVRVLVRDVGAARKRGVAAELLTSDVEAALRERADIVVELLGGVDLAGHAITQALALGRTVITANKSVLAAHTNDPIFQEAIAEGRLLFSAAVGGAAPLLEAVRGLRDREPVASIEGIINGTTNAILDAFARGATFEESVRTAREAGFAESDVENDLSGIDVAEKLTLLARAAFGVSLESSAVVRTRLSPESIRAAVGSPGGVVRYIASVTRTPAGLFAEVAPRVVPLDSPFAAARAEGNVAVIRGESGRTVVARGKGAGRWPTAEAVIADLLTTVSNTASPANVRDRIGRPAVAVPLATN